MNAIDIISQVSDTTFSEMMTCCSRKVRDTLCARLGVKAKSSSISLQLGQKRDETYKKLHEKFKNGDTQGHLDVCQEIIRNWLYTKRPMLKATLDFLKVPNDDGLVETELDFFKELSLEKTSALLNHVSKEFPFESVWVYLNFVEVPFVPPLLSMHDTNAASRSFAASSARVQTLLF